MESSSQAIAGVDAVLKPIGIGAVHDLMDRAVARFPKNSAIEFLGRTWTYAEVGGLVDRAARGFQDLGVKKGDRVVICLPNTPYAVVVYFAILKAGGIVVNSNPLYVERELEHVIKDSGATIAVTIDLKLILPKLSGLIGRTALKTIVVCPMAASLPVAKSLMFRLFKRDQLAAVPTDGSHMSFAALVARSGPMPVVVDPLTDVAVLQYTGGTTGTPKAAMLSHANVTANVSQIITCFPEVRDGVERMLAILPLFHVFAMTCIMNFGVSIGAQLILVPRFDVKQLLATIATRRPTIFPGVPTLYSALSAAVEHAPSDMTSLRYCISGGAPLSAEIKHRFESLAKCKVFEGYGLTEASPVVTANPLDDSNPPGSIGHRLAGTMVEIRSPDDGRILGPGEKGELCVRGPQVMLGYWNKPEETADAFVDGALRTGDIGYVDADGWYFIVDRIKDLIICSGFNVYPRVIEEALYQHPSVAEAIAIAVPDAYRGQAPKAYVTLVPSKTATPDELLAHLAGYISRIEMPREIEIRDSLPHTMVGKLSKKELVAEEAAKASHGGKA